jgi:glycogen debranching enzyme
MSSEQRTVLHAGASEELTDSQHRAREQILTRQHAAQLRMDADAIVLKCDDTFLVADPCGDVAPENGRGLGLFYRDTRFLSRYELTLEDRALIALSSQHSGGNWVMHALENESLESSPSSTDAHKLAVCRFRTAGDGAVRELIQITNYDQQEARFALRLQFEADFADIFEVRNISSQPLEQTPSTQLIAGGVRVSCTGQDGWQRAIELQFRPSPRHLSAQSAEFELSLAPRECTQIEIDMVLTVQGTGRRGAGEGGSAAGMRNGDTQRKRRAPADPRRLSRHSPPHGQELVDVAAEVRAHPVLDKVIRRSLLDLSLLRGELSPDLHYIAGGVPWYVTLFGRDSLMCALQICAYHAPIAGDTVRLLAKYQATRPDGFRDAQPGKILHELRRGQLAHLDAIPQSPAYYGSVDSTLLFLIVLAEYVNWSGDVATVRELRRHFDAALDWIEHHSDSDADGYVDYGGKHGGRGQYRQGLVNQGWKDSGDAIVNADGSLAEPPIALCEVQGYLYRAWRSAAGLLQLLQDRSGAESLEQRAQQLLERFERDFWSKELGCYLLARQRDGRPAEVVSSNAGQVLWSGLSSPEHARAVIQRMLAEDMFSGWGVRTLSSREKRYNPLSYHLGSIWPHDNSLLCAGFRQYGANDEALQIFNALFDAASGFRDHRMPELYCGFARGAEESHPVRYPVACSPQAWAAGSIPYALTSLLGLQPDAPEGRLRIVDPCLPDWIDQLTIARLRVGPACVDLRFERDSHGHLRADSSVREGTLTVTLSKR